MKWKVHKLRMFLPNDRGAYRLRGKLSSRDLLCMDFVNQALQQTPRFINLEVSTRRRDITSGWHRATWGECCVRIGVGFEICYAAMNQFLTYKVGLKEGQTFYFRLTKGRA